MKPLKTILLLLIVAATTFSAHAQMGRSRYSERFRGRREDRTVSAAPERSRLPQNPSSGVEFDAFRLISDRNIFSSNRRQMRPNDASTTRPLAPPTEELRLVGALIHDAGTSSVCVAFFEGSRSEYNTSRKLGEAIASYRVAAIRTEGVRLVQEGGQVDIPVGGGMSRQSTGKWQVALVSGFTGAPRLGPPMPFVSATASTTGTATAAAPSGGSAGDVLKRMMERRRQQTER